MTAEQEPSEPPVKQDGKTIYDELAQIAASNREEIGMKEEAEKRDQAFQKYAPYQSEYYIRVNQERVDAANTPAHQKIKVDIFGDGAVTMIAQINTEKLDPDPDLPAKDQIEEGKVIDGHDYNPEAQSHQELEAGFAKWFAETPPEQRVIVFEGNKATAEQLSTRKNAIEGRGDSGLIQFLAKEAGVEVVQAEVDNTIQAQRMEAEGISRETSALFFTLRNFAAAYNDEPVPDDLSMYLYAELANSLVNGIELIPEAQQQSYQDDPAKLKQLKDKVAAFVPGWNETLQASGLPVLEVRPDGSIGFVEDERFAEGVSNNQVGRGASPDEESTPLEEVGRTNIILRDQQIFESIVDATKAGKKPFVVYGGSHVVSLEPVLEEYYGSMESSIST